MGVKGIIMFDFFKTVYYEMNDFDSIKISEIQKTEKKYFGKSVRVFIFIVGILYICMMCISIYISVMQKDRVEIFKSIFKLILSNMAFLCFLIDKMKAHIIGIIIVLFIIGFSIIT